MSSGGAQELLETHIMACRKAPENALQHPAPPPNHTETPLKPLPNHSQRPPEHLETISRDRRNAPKPPPNHLQTTSKPPPARTKTRRNAPPAAKAPSLWTARLPGRSEGLTGHARAAPLPPSCTRATITVSKRRWGPRRRGHSTRWSGMAGAATGQGTSGDRTCAAERE